MRGGKVNCVPRDTIPEQHGSGLANNYQGLFRKNHIARFAAA